MRGLRRLRRRLELPERAPGRDPVRAQDAHPPGLVQPRHELHRGRLPRVRHRHPVRGAARTPTVSATAAPSLPEPTRPDRRRTPRRRHRWHGRRHRRPGALHRRQPRRARGVERRPDRHGAEGWPGRVAPAHRPGATDGAAPPRSGPCRRLPRVRPARPASSPANLARLDPGRTTGGRVDGAGPDRRDGRRRRPRGLPRRDVLRPRSTASTTRAAQPVPRRRGRRARRVRVAAGGEPGGRRRRLPARPAPAVGGEHRAGDRAQRRRGRAQHRRLPPRAARSALDPSRAAGATGRPAPPLTGVPGGRSTRVGVDADDAAREVLAWRVPELVAYQDVARTRRATSTSSPGRARAEPTAALRRSDFSTTVARNLFHLMAYKDEYEVARLHRRAGVAATRSTAEFGAARATSPSTCNRRSPAASDCSARSALGARTGRRRCSGASTKMTRLRGTQLDPFGRSAERRDERRADRRVHRGWSTGSRPLLGSPTCRRRRPGRRSRRHGARVRRA